jgi:uncharacterized protein (TIGR02231 family)
MRAPSEPVPPRLRYAYLRLRSPEEPARGTLRPVDPLRHLWDLVDDHETSRLDDLRRASQALQAAQTRLLHKALPKGTRVPDRSSFLHVYDAPGAHSVPSDGSYHRVLVDRSETTSELQFRCVPREAEEVYRFCLLKTPPGTPLPGGPLQVYEEGDFRVTSALEASGGGKRLELNLGVESGLRMVGRTAHIHQAEKGLVSQTSNVEHKVSVQLRSGLEAPARVLVYDRLPIADDNEKDLEVALNASEPAAVQDDKDPRGDKLEGGLHWSLEVAPGELAKIEYTYLISLPAKSEVIGGNRRE